MIARHCPTHGDVIPVRGRCPWGCEHEFPVDEPAKVPVVDSRIAAPSIVAANARELFGAAP